MGVYLIWLGLLCSLHLFMVQAPTDWNGIRKTEHFWNPEGRKTDEKSRFIPFWKITRALQDGLSGIILHPENFRSLLAFLYTYKSKLDSKTLDYIWFLIISWILIESRIWIESKLNPFLYCFFVWYKARKERKKIWFWNSDIFPFSTGSKILYFLPFRDDETLEQNCDKKKYCISLEIIIHFCIT